MFQTPIADPARLAHKRNLHGGQGPGGFIATNPRWPRQRKGIGHPVEILGHAQIGIIDDIVGAVGAAMAQCRNTSGGQILGVNMIGEHVISLKQGRHAFVQTLKRQAIRGINARRSQDGNGDPSALPPLAQTTLGIDTPASARTFRIEATGFIDTRASTVAINPRRTYVNKPPW